jgi:hypothetical protein
MRIVAREEKILNEILAFLRSFEKDLSTLIDASKRYVKPDLINKLVLLSRILEKTYDRVGELKLRNFKEQNDLATFDSEKMSTLIDDLKAEEYDFASLVKDTKPHDLSKIDAFFSGIYRTRSAEGAMFTGVAINMVFPSKSHVVVKLASAAVTGIIAAICVTPISVCEALWNTAYGYSASDKSLKAEIERLKSRKVIA